MDETRVVPGMSVIASDGKDIGLVEDARGRGFTVRQHDSATLTRISLRRVQAVDDAVRLSCDSAAIRAAGGRLGGPARGWIIPLVVALAIATFFFLLISL